MSIGSIKDPPLPMPASRTGVAKAGLNESRKIFCTKHEQFHPASETCHYCDAPKEAKKKTIVVSKEVAAFFGDPKTLRGFCVGDRVMYSGVGPGEVTAIEPASHSTEDYIWIRFDSSVPSPSSRPDGAWWVFPDSITKLP